jgi:hypothetical protein
MHQNMVAFEFIEVYVLDKVKEILMIINIWVIDVALHYLFIDRKYLYQLFTGHVCIGRNTLILSTDYPRGREIDSLKQRTLYFVSKFFYPNNKTSKINCLLFTCRGDTWHSVKHKTAQN